MERRQDTRFPAQIPVEFVALNSGSEYRSGFVRDVSEGGLRLSTEHKLVVGAFLRINLDDSVLFGEVKYCCPWMGGYMAGLYIERVLIGSSDLSRLVSRTLENVPRITACPA